MNNQPIIIPPEPIEPYNHEMHGELYQAKADCAHMIQAQRAGGIKCIKCGRWFCH